MSRVIYKQVSLLLFSFLFSTLLINQVMEKIYVEVGIHNIETISEGNVRIDIFSLNKIPVAGVQFEINPTDFFVVDSILGGRCAEEGFNLYSNEKGLLLGFSMEAREIPTSIDKKPENNLLFSVYARIKGEEWRTEEITLNPTFAAKGGEKINVKSLPYIHIDVDKENIYK